ncbi:hypothetical protein [Spiroplasma endosymbiont of Phycita roborella]|uniref:hypothetical protein n=1 Tax=Spiroplasma endosymbiont of Phycita roborella TaxID=3066311 RepID=UPI00313C1C22
MTKYKLLSQLYSLLDDCVDIINNMEKHECQAINLMVALEGELSILVDNIKNKKTNKIE